MARRQDGQKVPGLWGGIMARKWFIDDTLVEAAADSVEAVVDLGAGFDTRSFRLPELAEVRTWEVIQPGSIHAKSQRLKAIFEEVPAHATLVPVDFDRGNLEATLVAQRLPRFNQEHLHLGGCDPVFDGFRCSGRPSIS